MGLTRSQVFAGLLTFLGAVLIIAGVTAIYWPAGLITAGLLLLAALFGLNVE